MPTSDTTQPRTLVLQLVLHSSSTRLGSLWTPQPRPAPPQDPEPVCGPFPALSLRDPPRPSIIRASVSIGPSTCASSLWIPLSAPQCLLGWTLWGPQSKTSTLSTLPLSSPSRLHEVPPPPSHLPYILSPAPSHPRLLGFPGAHCTGPRAPPSFSAAFYPTFPSWGPAGLRWRGSNSLGRMRAQVEEASW